MIERPEMPEFNEGDRVIYTGANDRDLPTGCFGVVRRDADGDYVDVYWDRPATFATDVPARLLRKADESV